MTPEDLIAFLRWASEQDFVLAWYIKERDPLWRKKVWTLLEAGPDDIKWLTEQFIKERDHEARKGTS